MDKIKKHLKLLTPYVTKNAKALVGLVIGSLVSLLAQHGINIDLDTASALEAGIHGLIVAIWTWYIPNSK